MMLIFIIISFVTLLLTLFSFYNNWFSSSDSLIDYTECRLALSSLTITEIRQIYSSTSTQYDSRIKDILVEACKFNKVEITDDNLANAKNLVQSCHRRFLEGKDILKFEDQGSTFCMYCGSIKAKNQVDDFNKKFSKFMKEDTYFVNNSKETISLNNETIYSQDRLPLIIPANDFVDVMYFIHRNSNDEKSYSGLIISDHKNKNDFPENINSLDIQIQTSRGLIKCEPEKTFIPKASQQS